MSSPSGDGEPRTAIEGLWRDRLQDAKRRLDSAQNYTNAIASNLTLGAVPSPIGNFAHLQAQHAENLALRKYHRVLRIFTELVLSGKIPNEAEW